MMTLLSFCLAARHNLWQTYTLADLLLIDPVNFFIVMNVACQEKCQWMALLLFGFFFTFFTPVSRQRCKMGNHNYLGVANKRIVGFTAPMGLLTQGTRNEKVVKGFGLTKKQQPFARF